MTTHEKTIRQNKIRMSKKNNIVPVEPTTDMLGRIQHSILVLRGKQVLLDYQLAALYGVTTGALNQAVKRNIERFPEDFMFQIDRQEFARLRSQFATGCVQGADSQIVTNMMSQIVISSTQSADNQQNQYLLDGSLGGQRKASALPYAFTEQGVAMLSSVLRSPTAIQVNIAIMRAFVMARQIVVETKENALAIEDLRPRMQMLEQALAYNQEATDNLSEEVKREMKKIYKVLSALTAKKEEPLSPIGYEAIWEREHKDEKKEE